MGACDRETRSSKTKTTKKDAPFFEEKGKPAERLGEDGVEDGRRGFGRLEVEVEDVGAVVGGGDGAVPPGFLSRGFIFGDRAHVTLSALSLSLF